MNSDVQRRATLKRLLQMCYVCTIINYNVIVQIVVVFFAFLVASCVTMLAHDMAMCPFEQQHLGYQAVLIEYNE